MFGYPFPKVHAIIRVIERTAITLRQIEHNYAISEAFLPRAKTKIFQARRKRRCTVEKTEKKTYMYIGADIIARF